MHLSWHGLLDMKDPRDTLDAGKSLELLTLGVGNSLEVLSLYYYHDRGDNKLVPWLQQCPNLTQLALHVRFPNSDLGLAKCRYTEIFVSTLYNHSIACVYDWLKLTIATETFTAIT
jgi:hypothetical protein